MPDQEPIPGGADVLLESFCPIFRSLDWRLRTFYWDLRGGQAFLSGEVPSSMTNDGVLAARVGDVLYAHCREVDAMGALGEQIRVMELGAGLGLHARLVLDRFKARCLEDGRDDYTRLEIYVTDMSSDMLAGIDARGTFAPWEGQVHLGQVDAQSPSTFISWPDGAERPLESIQVAWCNYLMCLLPFSLFRPCADDPQRWMELQARTWLVNGGVLPYMGEADLQPWVEQLGRSEEANRRLLDLRHRLAIDWSWQEVETIPREAESAAFLDEVVRPTWRPPDEEVPFVLASWGALECLEAMMDTVLAPTGVMLFGDYGWSTPEALAQVKPTYQHFGASAAMGVSFPWLDAVLADGAQMCCLNSEGEPLFVGCVSRAALPETIAAARATFGAEGRTLQDYHERAEAVGEVYHRDPAGAARLAEALCDDFPESWLALCLWASLETSMLRDPEKGLALALRAVALNATCSARPWIEVGDALYGLGRTEDAHAAYLRAVTISPEDPEAHDNLMWTFFDLGYHAEALQAACQTLIHDRTQERRASVFQKMGEILDDRAAIFAALDETGVG